MIRGIDHVVVLAADLSASAQRFEGAGFSVIAGGRHPAWGTENALIPLADGTYIELLAAHDPRLASRHHLWSRPDGSLRVAGTFGGFALETDDLEEDIARVDALQMKPQKGERHRPDGTVVRWRSAFPERSDLPFLIEDVTARSLRVPAPGSPLNSHLHLAGVVVAVGDLTASAKLYGALLTLPPELTVSGRTVFATGRGRIALRAVGSTPSAPEPGLAAIILSATDGTATADFTEIAGGAIMRAVRPGDDSWISS